MNSRPRVAPCRPSGHGTWSAAHIVHADLYERAIGRVERGFPQLFRVHFAQAFEPSHVHPFFAGVADRRQETAQVREWYGGIAATQHIPRLLIPVRSCGIGA